MEGKKKGKGKGKDKDKETGEERVEEDYSSAEEGSVSVKQNEGLESRDGEAVRTPQESAPRSPKGTETPASRTAKGMETASVQSPKGVETSAPLSPKGTEVSVPLTPKSTEVAQSPKAADASVPPTPKTEISVPGTPKSQPIESPAMQKQRTSAASVISKGTTKKVSGEIEMEPESFQEEKASLGVFSAVGAPVSNANNEVKGGRPNNGRPGGYNNGGNGVLQSVFPCSPGLFHKRSPFIHNPPQPEERRERIPCPRTPREYIINLRENLADFQESHGLPRSRDYSFFSLGLALAQETGRAIFSLFHMFTELFPILAIVSLILRFALDKLIEILETDDTGTKIKKSIIFSLEMIAIIIPLWILIGTIILPLLGLVVTILKNMLRIKGNKKTVVVRQKPKVLIKSSCSYK